MPGTAAKKLSLASPEMSSKSGAGNGTEAALTVSGFPRKR